MKFSGSILNGSLARGRGNGPGPIGFDLAAEKLNLLQVERDDGGVFVRAAASVPYPDTCEELIASPKALRKFVLGALKLKPFKGRNIVTCMPKNSTKIFNLKYHHHPHEDNLGAIIAGVKEKIVGEVEDYVIDYLPTRYEKKTADEHSILVAAARRDEIISYLELLHGISLQVDAIDIGPSALRRLVALMNPGEDYPYVLLINFGRKKTYLTVTTGLRLMMDREVDFGEQLLVAELCRALDIPEEKALHFLYHYGIDWDVNAKQEQRDDQKAKEIISTITEILTPVFMKFVVEVNKVLIYTASETRGGAIKKIYLLGSVARYPMAASFLAKMFTISVEVLNPFSEFSSRSDSAIPADLDPIAGIALATGFALRGMYDYA